MPGYGFRWGYGWNPNEGRYGFGNTLGPIPGPPPKQAPKGPPKPPALALVVERNGNMQAETKVRLPIGFDGLVGRSPSAAIILSHAGTSREHARLTVDAEGTWIADLSSSNGTFVNGVRIEEWTELVVGDVIDFGPTRAAVQIASDNSASGKVDRSVAPVVLLSLIVLLGLLIIYFGVSA